MFNKFIQQMSDDIPYLRAVVMDIVSAIARFIGSRDPSIDFHRVNRQYKTRTADYGLGIKHGLGYKTRTKHYGLGIKYGPSITDSD